MEEKSGRVIMELFRRLRLPGLIERFPARIVWAVFVFINGFVTCAILAWMAMAWKTTFIFPSLGPTAFMVFFNPTSAAASPRNAILGHAIGIITAPVHLLIIELAVVVLAIQAIVVNRIAGVDYPIWARRISRSETPTG